MSGKYLKQAVPLFLSPVSAGFPSPAEDVIDRNLDLHEYLIKHPAATYFVRVVGDSMLNAGIHHGDILVVDRSIKPESEHIVVASLNGDFTVKHLVCEHKRVFLEPDNPRYTRLEVTTNEDFTIWGVVTGVIRKL